MSDFAVKVSVFELYRADEERARKRARIEMKEEPLDDKVEGLTDKHCDKRQCPRPITSDENTMNKTQAMDSNENTKCSNGIVVGAPCDSEEIKCSDAVEHTRKRFKKTVRWASEERLHSYQYIPRFSRFQDRYTPSEVKKQLFNLMRRSKMTADAYYRAQFNDETFKNQRNTIARMRRMLRFIYRSEKKEKGIESSSDDDDDPVKKEEAKLMYKSKERHPKIMANWMSFLKRS